MNHKFIILGLCALTGLAGIFIFASEPGRKRSAPAAGNVVIAPDGTLTVEPKKDGWAMTVTMEQPKAKTNTSNTITNSPGK